MLSWYTPVYLVAIYGLVCYFMPPKSTDDKKLNWSLWEALGVTIFTYFAGQLIAAFLISIVPVAQGWTKSQISYWLTHNSYAQFGLSLLMTIAILGLVWQFVRIRKGSLKRIGLSGRPELNDLSLALVWFGVYFAINMAATLLISHLVPSLNTDQKQEIGFKSVTNIQLPFVFLTLVIMPPIMEEIVMRGFLYTSLKQKWPKYLAVIVTSLLFAAAHLQFGSGAPLLWTLAIDTFILSVILIHLRDKTDKLWAPMILHATKNLIAFLTIFIFVAK